MRKKAFTMQYVKVYKFLQVNVPIQIKMHQVRVQLFTLKACDCSN